MTAVPILAPPEQRWECPNCDVTSATRRADVHTEMHHCRGLAGLWTPMVPAGQHCKVVAQEREDYIGRELVQLDGNRRPVMAAVITRDEGEDRAVYVPLATNRD